LLEKVERIGYRDSILRLDVFAMLYMSFYLVLCEGARPLGVTSFFTYEDENGEDNLYGVSQLPSNSRLADFVNKFCGLNLSRRLSKKVLAHSIADMCYVMPRSKPIWPVLYLILSLLVSEVKSEVIGVQYHSNLFKVFDCEFMFVAILNVAILIGFVWLGYKTLAMVFRWYYFVFSLPKRAWYWFIDYKNAKTNKILSLEKEVLSLKAALAEKARVSKLGLQQEAAIRNNPALPIVKSDPRVLVLYDDTGSSLAASFKIRQLRDGSSVMVTAAHAAPNIIGATRCGILGSSELVPLSYRSVYVVPTLDVCYFVMDARVVVRSKLLRSAQDVVGSQIRVYTPGDGGFSSIGVMTDISAHGGRHTASTYPSSSGAPLISISDSSNYYFGMHYGGTVVRDGDNVNFYISSAVLEAYAHIFFDDDLVQESYLDTFLSWATKQYSGVYCVVYQTVETGYVPHLVNVTLDTDGFKLKFYPRDAAEAKEILKIKLDGLSLRASDNSSWADQMDLEEAEQYYGLIKRLDDPVMRNLIGGMRKFIMSEKLRFDSNPREWLQAVGLWSDRVPSVSVKSQRKTSLKRKGKRSSNKETQHLFQETGSMQILDPYVKEILIGRSKSKVISKKKTVLDRLFMRQESQINVPPALCSYFKPHSHDVQMHDASDMCKPTRETKIAWFARALDTLSWPRKSARAILDSFHLHCLKYLSKMPVAPDYYVSEDVDRAIACKMASYSAVTSVGLVSDVDILQKLDQRIRSYLLGPNFLSKCGDKSFGVSSKETKAKAFGVYRRRDGTVVLDEAKYKICFAEISGFVMDVLGGLNPELKIKAFIKDEPHKKEKVA